MDLSALISGLITDDTVKKVSKKAKASKKDVTSVLTSALPMLLANGNQTTTQQVAQASGVSQSTTSNVLGAAAPMLLNMLGGGQGASNSGNSSSNSASAGGLNLGMLTSLLGKVDLGNLMSGLMGLVSTNTSGKKDEKPSSGKKPSTGKKPASSGKKPSSSAKKPASSGKKPASTGKKPASGKKEESSGNPLSAVTGLLGKLFKK